MNLLTVYGVRSKYGANDPQAIVGVVMKVFTIAVNLAVEISAGCQPVFGFNYGAERYGRLDDCAHESGKQTEDRQDFGKKRSSNDVLLRFYCLDLYASPHAHMESRMGFRLFPSSVNEYSTLGGTSA